MHKESKQREREKSTYSLLLLCAQLYLFEGLHVTKTLSIALMRHWPKNVKKKKKEITRNQEILFTKANADKQDSLALYSRLLNQQE